MGRTPLAAAAVLAWLLLALAVAAQPELPPLTGRIVDRAELLSPAAEQRIAAQLEAHERATGNQVVVVTLETLQGYDIADYGFQLGRHWGIGRRGEDDGLLLIVAPNERLARIEVGYGLEGVMTDALSHDIIQNRILPQFRQGDFEAGIEAGVTAILAALGGEYQPVGDRRSGSPEAVVPIILFFGFVILFHLLRYSGRGGRRRGGRLYGPIGGVGGRRGGFGGGGFRGGGGSFGGGGASGRW